MAACFHAAVAWAPPSPFLLPLQRNHETRLFSEVSSGCLHGENACFLPIKQLDQDYYAPRIIQVRAYYEVCC